MSNDFPVTIYIQHADGYDTIKEALDIEAAIHRLEHYAEECLDLYSDEEIEKMFPMWWSICELGANDIYVSGVLNEDMSVSPD